ncbi:hypothetical protein [Marinobacter sp. C2H3]|uniref:hypothetical protein n=1 Tax=Marinobacter sp. C2H3 TaxID=3119003 RepID=UPI00300F0C39
MTVLVLDNPELLARAALLFGDTAAESAQPVREKPTAPALDQALEAPDRHQAARRALPALVQRL